LLVFAPTQAIDRKKGGPETALIEILFKTPDR